MKAGLLKVEDGKNHAGAQAYVYPKVVTALVYVTVPDPASDILSRTKSGACRPRRHRQSDRAPDYAQSRITAAVGQNQDGRAFLTAKDGYAFAAELATRPHDRCARRESGAHGYVSTDPDLQALFIASGRGIRPGTTLDTVNNVDIAPTAADTAGPADEEC